MASGLAPTRHHREDDRLSITELGWGVGEIAKFWKTLQDAGVERPAYLEFAKRLADFFVEHYDDTDPFGRIWSLMSGEKLEGGGDGGGTLVSAEHQCIDPYATVAIPDLFDLADLSGEDVWREAGRLIWVNAVQDVAGPDVGSLNGCLRTPGAQCEAHAQTRWSKYRSDPVAARGHFNNQCTAFIVTFRLYALDRVGDPMKEH